METSANAGGLGFAAETIVVDKKPGFLVIVKTAAQEVFGHLLTGKFWFNLAKRIMKVVAVTATEAAFTAAADAFLEAKGKVRKTAGVDDGDPLLRSVGDYSTTPAAAAFSRPYQPTSGRTFSPTPGYSPGYQPVQYPPATSEPFPGFSPPFGR